MFLQKYFIKRVCFCMQIVGVTLHLDIQKERNDLPPKHSLKIINCSLQTFSVCIFLIFLLNICEIVEENCLNCLNVFCFSSYHHHHYDCVLNVNFSYSTIPSPFFLKKINMPTNTTIERRFSAVSEKFD